MSINLKIKTFILSFILPISAFANDATPTHSGKTSLTPYVGLFDVSDKTKYTMLGMEYRHKKYYGYIVPKLGGYINNKNSAYGYLGLNIDLPVYKESLYVVPGFSVGWYSKGKGKNLGGVLQFRSSIEIAYKMPNQHRIGVAFSHISNAGIYKKNPGAEDIIVNYSIPLGD